MQRRADALGDLGIFGCLLPAGPTYRVATLGTSGDFDNTPDTASDTKVALPWVSVLVTDTFNGNQYCGFGGYSCFSTRSVRWTANLRTGARFSYLEYQRRDQTQAEMTNGTVPPPSPAVVRVLLSHTGQLPYATVEGCPGPSCAVRILLVDARHSAHPVILDSASSTAELDPHSLVLRRAGATWVHGGQRRIARLAAATLAAPRSGVARGR